MAQPLVYIHVVAFLEAEMHINSLSDQHLVVVRVEDPLRNLGSAGTYRA